MTGVLAGVLGVLLSVGAGNVRSVPELAPTDVQADVAALFSFTPTAVLCANELAPRRYKRAFLREATRLGYRVVGLGTENPVAVRHSGPWHVLRVRVRLLSRGVEGITPDRTATVVVLARRHHRAVVLCTHLVSRAWTHQEATTGLRQDLWRQAARRIRWSVRWWTSRDVSVVVAGDLNRPESVPWTSRGLTVANQGLIQVAAIPGRHQEAARAPGGRTIGTQELATDHPMVRRVVRLEPVASGP